MRGQSNVACFSRIECTDTVHTREPISLYVYSASESISPGSCRQHLQFIGKWKPVSMKFTCSASILIPYGEYPSCLHTTLASLLSQKSSQMVPQVPLTHTSTLPNLLYLLSSTNCSSPSLHGAWKTYISLVSTLILKCMLVVTSSLKCRRSFTC